MDNNIEKRALIKDDKIDFIAITKTIWEGRRIIIKSTIICTVIGLFIAILSPKEYIATTTFIPQVSDGKSMGGSLGGLAAMAGIDLGNMGGNADISPSLYPQIIASTNFCKEIMVMELTLNKLDTAVTFYDYFTEIKSPSFLGYIEKYTIGLPALIKKALKPAETVNINNTNNIQILSREEYELMQLIPEIINASVNEEQGVVTLSAVMNEALAAALVAKKAQELLQKNVTRYKVVKAKKELNFVNERYLEQKVIFEDAQNKVAEYADQNKNITSARAKAEYERLSTDYQLKSNVYNELAKQLEQAKLKVSEDTPNFSMIQEVVIPMKKSAPKRIRILFAASFLGIFMGIASIFAPIIWSNLRDAF